MFLIFSSSCQQKKIAQIPNDLGTTETQVNPITQGIENLDELASDQKEDGKNSKKTTPIPNFKLVFQKDYQQVGFDPENKKEKIIFPIGTMNNQFEYICELDLHRLNLETYQETVFKDTFKYLTFYQPLNPINQLNKNHVIMDQNCYYYAEDFEIDPKNEDYDKKFESNIVCKDRNTLKVLWKIKLFKGIVIYPNGLVQNGPYLLYSTSNNMTFYCIKKKSGQILWTFEPAKLIPYLNKTSDNHNSESTISRTNIELIKITDQGYVLYMQSIDNRKQLELSDSIFKIFYLSFEGKLLNQIDSKEIGGLAPYEMLRKDTIFNNHYLYFTESEFGYKDLNNSKIFWRQSIPASIKNAGSDNDQFFQEDKYLFWTHKNMSDQSVKVYDIESGQESFSCSLHAKEVFSVESFQNEFYILCNNEENSEITKLFVLTMKEKKWELKNHILDIPNLGGFDVFSTTKQRYFFWRDGCFVIKDSGIFMNQLPEVKVLCFKDHFVYQNNNTFVHVINNSDRGYCPGGAIFVFKEEK
jgi:hypothetical protein